MLETELKLELRLKCYPTQSLLLELLARAASSVCDSFVGCTCVYMCCCACFVCVCVVCCGFQFQGFSWGVVVVVIDDDDVNMHIHTEGGYTYTYVTHVAWRGCFLYFAFLFIFFLWSAHNYKKEKNIN